MQVFLLAALTADGFVGKTDKHRSSDWTSPEDLHFYVDRIKEADAIIIGSKTFATFKRYPKGSHWVVYTSHPQDFQNPKPEVITAEATSENPQELISRLQKQGRHNIAIVGGASIYSLFMSSGLVNKLYLTIEPILFGTGVKLFNQPLDIPLKFVQAKPLSSQTIVLEYDIQK